MVLVSRALRIYPGCSCGFALGASHVVSSRNSIVVLYREPEPQACLPRGISPWLPWLLPAERRGVQLPGQLLEQLYQVVPVQSGRADLPPLPLVLASQYHYLTTHTLPLRYHYHYHCHYHYSTSLSVPSVPWFPPIPSHDALKVLLDPE